MHVLPRLFLCLKETYLLILEKPVNVPGSLHEHVKFYRASIYIF